MSVTVPARRWGTLAIVILIAGALAACAVVPQAAWAQTGAVTTQAVYGFLFSIVALALLRATGRTQAERIWLTALVAVMPLPYVRSLGPGEPMGIEAAGLVLFPAAAVASLVALPWLLPAGLVAHGLWDLAHLGRGPVPDWYAIACAFVDVPLGIYAWSRLPAWRA
jgi:hypothetical protein